MTTRSASERISAGPSSEATPTQTALGERALGGELAQGGEGVEVGPVVAAVERPGDLALADQAPHGNPLVDRGDGAQLEHHAAEVRHQALLGRELGDRSRALLGRLGVAGPAPVDRLDRALVLESQAEAGEVRPIEARLTNPAAAAPRSPERRVEARPLLARAEQLEAVVAGVDELIEADHAAGGARPAAADAGDQSVARRELGKQRPGRRRNRRRLGVGDDRRQGAVDVAEDGGARGLGAQRGGGLDRIGGGHRPN